MTHYRDLEIYNLSYEAFILIHKFTQKLPRQESYELGSQLRRSADSINSNIVEGYGRRKYVNEYRKFIIYSHASCDESINHLKKLAELYPEFQLECHDLLQRLDLVGRKINRFLRSLY